MLTRSTSRPEVRLALELLDAREVPAINILVDYSLDLRANGGAGFFETNAAAKATMNRVAYEMGQRVTANLSAITPGVGKSWSALFYDPRTGKQTSVSNRAIAANTVVVYVGGRAIPGAEAGFGGPGGYSWAGPTAWGNLVAGRGWGGFSLWGGSITFDSSERWHFEVTTAGLDANELDFYSVATHEVGHVLGIGTAAQWTSLSRNGYFMGTAARSVYGAPVPLAPDGDHWRDGLTVHGQILSLDPTISYGTRVAWSSLDQAGLRDMGWAAGAMVSPPTTPPVPPAVPPPPSPPPSLPPLGSSTRQAVLVSGTGGRVFVYARGTDGNLASAETAFTPFAGFGGSVRTAVADFDGDRIADYVFSTGTGAAAKVRIISGATGSDIVGPTQVLGGYRYGTYVAAGDMDGDGKAELVVSSDSVGFTRVLVYKVVDGQLQAIARVLPFAPNVRSGARVAVGDLDGDGRGDLIVGAARGAPVVRIYDGAALAAGLTVRSAAAFFAFDRGSGRGVNVAAGDLDGDGRAELIVASDTGSTPLVKVWSGKTLIDNPTVMASSLPTYQQFYANGTSDRGGIRVVARDIDGNGTDELVTSSGTAGWLRVLSVTTTSVDPLAALYPAGPQGAMSGVYVG